MKTIAKLFVLTSLLILFGANTQAQVTTNSSAEATIVATIDLVLDVPLNFGNLAVTTTAGVVTLEPSAAATRTQLGGVTFPIVPGTVDAATFFVIGEANVTYDIDIPLPAWDLTITNGTANMIVNNWLSSPSGAGLLDGSGEQTLYVGADLHVDAMQEPGVYFNGTGFPVTVNYN